MRSIVLVATMALAAPLGLVAVVAADTATAPPAAAHGSVTNPPTRNYSCLERWGDDHLNPNMADTDPMCAGAWQHDPNAMWNWNGLYRENVGGNHQAAVPSGTLCSGGKTFSPRYDYLDTPGGWVAKGVPTNFTLTLTDGANHGADYLRIYVTKPGFNPSTTRLGWEHLDLVKETGRYPAQSPYVTDVNLSGRSGRAVLFTIWQASHLDQPYYLCSDINIGGSDWYPNSGSTPSPDPTTPSPDPTTPSASPSVSPTSTPNTSPNPTTKSCTAAITVVNSWSGGYQADVKVTAGSSAISGWDVTVNGATINQAWNASLSGGNKLSDAGWNGNLSSGASTTAGFIASGSASGLSATCTAS
ncbi:lytic polysaccharide monooxygenase [Myceligenerans crystallogenes]